MNKSFFIISTLLAAVIFTAFPFIKWNTTPSCSLAPEIKVENPSMLELIHNADSRFSNTITELIYDVGSRFSNTITKDKLINAKSIIDLIPDRATKSITSFHYTRISILENSAETNEREEGNSEILTNDQIKLLQTVDYSTDIFIKADYKIKNVNTGESEDSYLTYYISILPEKEAEYIGGHDKLIKYLREGSKEKVAIIRQNKLQPGKVSFTITNEGEVVNVRLTSTSGFSSVDQHLVDLITNMPGAWHPAIDSNGDKVDQELVFFFGKQGC